MSKIINFHDVHDSEWFEMIITILNNKYNVISIDALESYYYERGYLKNACHFTFDDGDKTFYDTIYPVLKKHNIPASIFVSPRIILECENFWFQEIQGFNQTDLKKIFSKHFQIDYKILNHYSLNMIFKNLKIDDIWYIIETYKEQYKVEVKKVKNMNVEQLLEIDRDGLVVIGGHTLNHPILANESEEKSKKEIVDSINGLREILGHEIKYFAIPNGLPNLDFTAREIDILKNNNCRLAFITIQRDFTINDNPLSIPRYGISSGDSDYFIRAKLFLGDYWEKFNYLKIKREKRKRNELKKIIHMNSLLSEISD